MEKATVLLIVEILIVVGIFVPICPNILNAFISPLTKEEAIEISKNTKLFKEGTELSTNFACNVYFHNSTEAEGQDAWEVTWIFWYKEVPGGYDIIVIVDAETGIIIREEKGARYR